MPERLSADDPAVQQALGRRTSKYGAIKVKVDGFVFDSKREAARYADLKVLHALEVIRGLEVHPRFPFDIDGVHISTYEADFSYYESATGRIVVEDTKGVRTPVYRLKAKLLKALYGYDVVEI